MNNLKQIVTLVILAAAIRVASYAGYVGGDDWHYLTSAVELSSGTVESGGGHWQCRTAVTIPAALLHRFGAPSWMILGGATFAWSILCIPIAFWVGVEFTRSHSVGLLAAALVAIFPLDIIFATCLYPITGIAATTALSGVFFSRALRNHSKWDYLAIGACLGLSYLHRVTALYVGIPMLIWAIWKKEWHRGYILTAFAAMIFVLLEMTFFAVTEDDPLRRFHVLTARSDVQTTVELSYEDTAIRPGGPIFSPLVSLVTNQEFGLFYVALPFALFGLFKQSRSSEKVMDRPPQFAFVLLWLLTVLAYTMWGTTNPFDYRPLRPWPRYFSHVTIPLCVVLAYWLLHCMQFKARAVTLAALISVALLGVTIDSSRTFTAIGPQLMRIRQDHPKEKIRIVRHAYMFLFTANQCRPIDGVEILSLHPSGKDPRAELIRKISPDVVIVGAWDSVEDGIAIVRLKSVDDVPEHWQPVTEVLRPRTFAASLANWIGGPVGRLLNPSEEKHEFAVFRVLPKKSAANQSP